MKNLSELKAGQAFPFPEGTEDSGVRFTVLEQNGSRALVLAQIGLTYNPTSTYAGTEEVVAL